MFYVTKKFEVPMAHRLSKNERACQYVHGHNFIIYVTVQSRSLNNKDMVMDFHDLKETVNKALESWDHGIFLNENDPITIEKTKLNLVDSDPTSEVLCFYFFNQLEDKLPEGVILNSIKISETDGSESTFHKN